MIAEAVIVVLASIVGFLLVFGLRRDRPRRTLSRPLGDATARRARLRLVAGGGRSR
jgi:H+/gluconate symporter-like permease